MSAQFEYAPPVNPNAPEDSLEARAPYIDNGTEQIDAERYYSREFMAREWLQHWTRAGLSAGPRGDLEYLRLLEEYGSALSRRADTLTDEMQPVIEQRREAAARYTAARRDADILERLRDRRVAHHAKQRARDEQHALDEIAMHLHRRRSEDGTV